VGSSHEGTGELLYQSNDGVDAFTNRWLSATTAAANARNLAAIAASAARLTSVTINSRYAAD
jgi:hypothetical protein